MNSVQFKLKNAKMIGDYCSVLVIQFTYWIKVS